jgi:hypothetical protein
MATTAIAGSRNHCMEQLISAMGGLISFVSQNIMFVLISAVALLIVPGVLTWWVVAQVVNADRKDTGKQRFVGRWHVLRFGPMAPLLSLIAGIGGGAPVIIFQYALPVDILLPCVALGILGLTAFVISLLLWMYASDPAETARRSELLRTADR